MFKKFVEKIIESENPIEEVFYGKDGIDLAFQRDKITWKEHQMLLKLCERIEEA